MGLVPKSKRWLELVMILLKVYSLLGAERLPVPIGKFRSFSHGVKSGEVSILNEKMVRIKDFSFDGTGPSSWFVVGKGQEYKKEKVELKDFTVIPDEKLSCQKLQMYDSQTIKLTLPSQLKLKQFNYLAVYCAELHQNFGYVSIPKNMSISTGMVNANVVKDCKNKWNSHDKSSSACPWPFTSIFILTLIFNFLK